MKKDISGRADIELLVNSFYEKVKKDSLISHFFSETVNVDWNHHLPVMYRFWENALFYSGGYMGQPLNIHKNINAVSPLSMEHFQRWNKLFIETVDELFEGEKAVLAKDRAISIAAVMQLKIVKKA